MLYIIYQLNQHPHLVEFRLMDTAEFRRDTVEFRRDTVEFRRVRTEFPRAAKNILHKQHVLIFKGEKRQFPL